VVGIVLLAGQPGRSDLTISTVNAPVTVDFDTSISDVNNGQWSGAGFQSAATAGQLDSDSWAATGMDDGNLVFGGTQTTAGTDYTRGSVSTPQTTGGFYAYDVDPTATVNRTLWVQPGGTDFTPGTITLRVLNSTSVTVSNWDVSYTLYYNNDQARANSFNFSYSIDDATYTPVSSLDFTSPEAADALGVVSTIKTTQFSAPVSSGNRLYLRWSGNDVSGATNRDEFGLDDITLTAIPEPGASLLGMVVSGVIAFAALWKRYLC
jgi:hypothetical protein